MKLCFLVDYRSPIARNWIDHFIAGGHEVHVISSYPWSGATDRLASLHVAPLQFSALTERKGVKRYLSANGAPEPSRKGSATRTLGWAARRAGWMLSGASKALSSLDVYRHIGAVRAHIAQIQPDLVHAMRIPHEGNLAAKALNGSGVPLIISIWGNDITLHAVRSRLVAHATRSALARTSALHTDCHRDLRLAREWGFAAGRPAIVLPGNGGVQLDVFHGGQPDAAGLEKKWGIPARSRVVFNARSFRPSYVKNDVFFAAVPQVLARFPRVTIVCIGMKGNPVAERWRKTLATPDAVKLLPIVTREEMAELFRRADIAVSPSIHDGTPNTLLEAMASGAFPVAGDIESIREWITDGENGLLCDPTSVSAVADCIVRGLEDDHLRAHAASTNRSLVEERADYSKSMREAERFYQECISLASAWVSVGAAH